VLTDDPAQEVERLYDHFVNRQFAQREEYQEEVMARRIQGLFRAHVITDYRAEMLGDETYRFRVPFVRGELAAPGQIRVIKPLNLTQADTTRIMDHGYIWIRRVQRMLDLSMDADRMLIPVKTAAENKRASVARGVCDEFAKLGVRVVEFGRQDDIVEFAKAG
jgi:hypothetical protein